MKVHLFKVEQFFPEGMVLEAELKYPLTTIKMEKVKGNTSTYEVLGQQVNLSFDVSQEFITGFHCSCGQFNQESGCVHVILSAWEFRKHGVSEESNSGRLKRGFQISTLIDHIPARELKHFISGYAQKNNEFRQLLKLMFSHELDNFIGFKDINDQLNRVFKLYKSKLDTKKYQKKLAFYIRTFLGVAEDLLTQKDFRTALFYNLSTWKTWVAQSHHFRKLGQDEEIYGLIIKIFSRIEQSDISPDLYKFMVNNIKDELAKPDYQPVMEYDIPELLVEWQIWEDKEYDSFILNKFASRHFPESWVTRVLPVIQDKDQETKDMVRSKMQKVGRDQILRKITQNYSSLSPQNYLFLRRSFAVFSKEQLRSMESLLPHDHAFLIQLDLLVQYRELALLEEILYEHEYDMSQKEILETYLKEQNIPVWIKYLIQVNVLKRSASLDDLKSLDEPREWVHLLPHLSGENQRDVIHLIKNYCLNYAENHIGMRAKKHLQSIGHLLNEHGFDEVWSSIKNELVERFAHRRSFQSMDKPFS